MLFNNPLSPEKINSLIEQLWLNNSSLILDVGCGQGELLKKLILKFNCTGIGVDINDLELQKANENLEQFQDKLNLYNCPFESLTFPENHFDACFSIGSIHAFGKPGEAFDNALLNLINITRPGGLIIIGDCYWKKEPESEYLNITEITANEMRTISENINAGKKFNMECIYCIRASEDEWDHFEGSFWMNAERELIQNPDDKKLQEKVKKRRTWKQAYFNWGRETMGFAVYIFLVPYL